LRARASYDVASKSILRRCEHDHCLLRPSSTAYIENVIWQTLRVCLGASRKLSRGGDLFDAAGAGMTPAEGREVEDHVRERLGMPFLPKAGWCKLKHLLIAPGFRG